MKSTFKLLFIDDQWCRPEEQNTIIASFGSLLTKDPSYTFYYETAEASPNQYSVQPVLDRIKSIGDLDVLILDVMFGDKSDRFGLEILEAVRIEHPLLPIFMMTSVENNLEVLERAMELGANEYLVKRPTVEELEYLLRIYINPNTFESDFALWGNSKIIRNVRSQIVRVAAGGKSSVLITGESGTGKELVARSIHRQGPRRRYPFIDKNCAHSKSELLDDELFGHEKGAFTGAEKQLIGKIERADKGILFLDEIGSMPIELQGKLLRVIETRSFQRLGGDKNLFSDFQLISATNEDINSIVENKQIRSDFLFRVKQFEISIPPLRSRKEDIPILANLFLKKFKAGTGGSYRAEKFSSNALDALMEYNWPGNVRELKNIVERAAIICKKETIDLESLPTELIITEKSNRFSENVKSTSVNNLSNTENWALKRILAELEIALLVKEQVKSYKGNQWKAEFMRILYPENKAPSAKGFNDLIRRLTSGPWSIKNYSKVNQIKDLLDKLIL